MVGVLPCRAGEGQGVRWRPNGPITTSPPPSHPEIEITTLVWISPHEYHNVNLNLKEALTSDGDSEHERGTRCL